MKLEYIGLAVLLLGGIAIAATITNVGPGATTAAGGADTDVQYNSGGALAGSDNFVYSQSATLAGMSIIDPNSLAELDFTAGFQDHAVVRGIDGDGVPGFEFSDHLLSVFDLTGSGGVTLSGSLARITATSAVLTPVAAPPISCDANGEGAFYSDTSHALCWCSGSTWEKIAGSGTCS